MRRWIGRCALGLVSVVAIVSSAPAADERTSQAGQGRTVVLDTTGFWRLHHTLKPAVIRFDDGPKPVLLKQRWLNNETPEPPADWRTLEFDDSSWLRGPARMACKTPLLARLCMRGKFRVTDPARVQDLSLTLVYQGGAIVYLNGREVTRAHMSSPKHVKTDSAKPYPLEAYLTETGGLLPAQNWRQKTSEERLRRYALRERTLKRVVIPGRLLRKGTNVLAIEIVRAPYHQVVDQKKGTLDSNWKRHGFPIDFCFNTCEFNRVQLTAASGQGLIPNAARPQGFQVWNSNLMASDFDLDFGDPCEPLMPMRIVAARNGSFSGKVVVGSSRAIKGLKVSVTDLKGDGGAIPASSVQIRYATAWGREWGTWGFAYGYTDIKHWRYPRQMSLLGALAEAPLAEFPVRTKQPNRYDLKTPNQAEPVFGAVVPIWVTVNVPRTAAPGSYSGHLTIRAEGQKKVVVPIELRVAEWTLPDTQHYRSWVELVQSPDTLAVEYGVPLWSDRHWELIAHSLALIGRTGSRVLYVPLIAQTNLGNAESMVRWIERGDGKFEYDFSIMDRYLDTARKVMGRPKIVVLGIWEVYMMRRDSHRSKSSHDQEARTLRFLEKNKATIGGGPVVTVLDRATGRTSNAELPRLEDSGSRRLWQPLFAELRKRLKRRGLAGAMMLGDMSDAWPTRREAIFLKAVSGDLPWVSFSHMGVPNYKLHDVAAVGYQGHHAVNRWSANDQDRTSRHGWNRPELRVQFNRDGGLDNHPLARWRHRVEANITGEQRGVGRLGGDFWHAVKDKRGSRRARVSDRYPQSARRNLNILTSLLAPGPDGPVATDRFEIFREGVQECEARIVIERALIDKALKKRLGPKLARRCQEVLDERWLSMYKSMSSLQLTGPYFTHAISWWYFPVIDGNTWFIGSGWEQRTEKLFTLAGQVTRRIGKR